MKRRLIDVLVVDDSAVVREVMTAVLSQEPDIRVVTAADPIIAISKMRRNRPDVIILDLKMPRMDGLTFLKKVMSEDPIPVIVCSAVTGQERAISFRAIEHGAIGVVAKPRLGAKQFLHESAVTLIDAVRAAAHARFRPQNRISSSATSPFTADPVSPHRLTMAPGYNRDKVIAMGASTGGTEALRVILEAMPESAPGIVIVQHMPQGFTNALAHRLNETCRIDVKEAAEGDLIMPGRALLAPGNRHLTIRRQCGHYSAEILDGPLVSRHRPSVDVLFKSVAHTAGRNAIGVILTGMGSDGAAGLLEMRQSGARTFAQDQRSSVVFGMPKEAIERGAVCRVVKLGRIAESIINSWQEDGRASS
jgi:two-component system chemotaxis response regulator CheB